MPENPLLFRIRPESWYPNAEVSYNVHTLQKGLPSYAWPRPYPRKD